jgi:hypothetical protein
MVQEQALSAPETSSQEGPEELPFVLAQQQSESLELQLERTSPPPGRLPLVVQQAVAVQPSLRESRAKRQRTLVS